MPRGPEGEKRPADVIGNAVHVHADRDAGDNRLVPAGPTSPMPT